MSDSISKSFSKDSVYESMGFSMADAALEEIIRAESESISNEAIRRGDTLLGTYDVQSDPVKGGMGSVWRVHHRNWNVDLAMKRPLPKFFAEGSQRRKENFIRECESWIELGLHPNVVSCYYVREIGGVPTIFSEWMDNGSLGDRIRDGGLYGGAEKEREERLLSIAIQFADGLDHAHRIGMVHQDVKPDNVLLTNDWDCKVADFGLARARSFLTVSPSADPGGTMMTPTGGYTLAYRSPEQAAGDRLTRRTDIYSWALSVLETYVGKRLWEDGTKVLPGLRQCFETARVPVPEGLQALLSRCLSPLPEDRPHDFSEITEELCRIYALLTGTIFPRQSADSPADTAGAFNNRALSFLDLGKPEKADALLERALAAKTAHQDALFNRALSQLRRGETDLYGAKEQLAPTEDPALRRLMESELDKENTGTLELRLQESLPALPEGVLAISDDGSRVLKAEKPQQGPLWNILKKNSSGEEKIRYCVRTAGEDRLLCHRTEEKKKAVLRLSADGRFLIVFGAKYTEAVLVDTGKTVFRCEDRCTASPDGRYIVGYLPREANDFNGAITTSMQRRPFIYRLEKGTEYRFHERNDLITFGEDGRILFRDDSGAYRLYDPESEERYGQLLFSDRMEKHPVRCFGGGKGTRYLLENDQELYDLRSQKRLLRLPVRFMNTCYFGLLNEGEYGLTLSMIRKEHYDTEDGGSYLTAAVWELATGRLVYETQANALYRDRRRFLFYDYVANEPPRVLFEQIAGGTYTPGEKTDYRLTVIESIYERKTAARRYEQLLQEAERAHRQGNDADAVKYLRQALSVSGYENSEEALKLCAEYGRALTKTGRCRLVPLRVPAPKPEAKRACGKDLSPRIREILQEKEQEQIARFERKFREKHWTDYTALCWEDGVAYSENGRYLTVVTVTDEHYYNTSPEVNDPDPEDTYYRGFLLFDAEKETLIYENMTFLQDPEDDMPTIVTRKNYDAKFRVTPDNSGKYVLVISLDDELFLQGCGAAAPVKLLPGECTYAGLFDDGRYLLTLRRGGDAEIFRVGEEPYACGGVRLQECDKLYCIDPDRFAYTVYGNSYLCRIDWEYSGTFDCEAEPNYDSL